MVDITDLRENPDKYRKATSAKQRDPKVVDEFLSLDGDRRKILGEVEALRAERNKAAKEKNIEVGKKIKGKLQELEPKLKDIEGKYVEALYKIPNLFSEDTPEGKDESENKVIRTWGEPKKFEFKPMDHLDLGRALGIIDVDTAAKVSGTRFAYLKGDAVLLEFALIQFALSVLTDEKVLGEIASGIGVSSKTFIPVVPPVFVREEVFGKMDRLEPKEERYYIPSDELFLIGSAEHTLGPMYMDNTLAGKDLPLRYLGFSTSFRREAGSYGQDTKGILRVHQFDKLEMESFSLAENGPKEQEFFVAIQEYLMQKLGIPYQIIAICTGDMGKPDFRQIDLESWLPVKINIGKHTLRII